MAENNQQLDAGYRRLISQIAAHRKRLAEVMAGPETLIVLTRFIFGVLSAEALGAAMQTHPEGPNLDSMSELWSESSRQNRELLDLLVVISQAHDVDISFIFHLPTYGSGTWRGLWTYVRILTYHSRDSVTPMPQLNTIDNGDMEQDENTERNTNTEAQAITPYNPETDCPVCLLSYPRFVEFPCFRTHSLCEKCFTLIVLRSLVIECPVCRTIPFADMFR